MLTAADGSALEAPVALLAHAVSPPLYASDGAAGADLVAAPPEDAPIRLDPGAWAAVPTGLIIALPAGWEGQVRPRSGLARRSGVTVLNAPGTIDSDYRGEILVLLINHGPETVEIARGMRMAQLVIAPAARARFPIAASADALGATGRGAGGFGSTGADAIPAQPSKEAPC